MTSQLGERSARRDLNAATATCAAQQDETAGKQPHGRRLRHRNRLQDTQSYVLALPLAGRRLEAAQGNEECRSDSKSDHESPQNRLPEY
jgi:hypothetical protein